MRKKSRIFLFGIAIIISYCPFVNCQTHILGVKGGIYGYSYSGAGIIGNWAMVTQINGRPGVSFSIDYRYDQSHFYLSTMLGVSKNTSIFYPENLTPEIDYGGSLVFSTMYATSQYNIGMTQYLGFQYQIQKTNLRVFVGLTPSILFNAGTGDEFDRPWDEINESIHNSYEPFVLFGSWGIGIDYWRLTFEIRREYSLTPIIEQIEYQGEAYDFDYNQKRIFLFLGFNFYPWKPKKPEASPVF